MSSLCDSLAACRQALLVDGVGHPGVGSITGASNASVALAAGAAVVLICPSGVGAAVDSYNLNAAFFEASGVAVLGGISNRLPGPYRILQLGVVSKSPP